MRVPKYWENIDRWGYPLSTFYLNKVLYNKQLEDFFKVLFILAQILIVSKLTSFLSSG